MDLSNNEIFLYDFIRQRKHMEYIGEVSWYSPDFMVGALEEVGSQTLNYAEIIKALGDEDSERVVNEIISYLSPFNSWALEEYVRKAFWI